MQIIINSIIHYIIAGRLRGRNDTRCMTLLSNETGSESWWQAQKQAGIPRIEPADDRHFRVTFFWRDADGSEATSPLRRVWLNITGVTDHHQRAVPRSLQRVTGTDVWLGSYLLPATWRGSYSLIPDRQARDFNGEPDMMTLRAWWRDLLPAAQVDSLNPLRSWCGGRGNGVSPLHMPLAPDQQLWEAVDRGEETYIAPQHDWQSARLGNRRRIWIIETGAPHVDRPLAILLDGQFWATKMPIAGPLHTLTQRGDLPSAVYILIDVIDTAHRSAELPCNADFWLAVQQELLPKVQTTIPFTADPQQTLVAGQSFGGLSAVYAALHWPQRFGAAISQSGSFWWPDRALNAADQQPGWLNGQIAAGLGQGQAQRFFIEAGSREPLVLTANHDLHHQLTDAGHQVNYRLVEGGHDALCWRGGLLDGLTSLWQRC